MEKRLINNKSKIRWKKHRSTRNKMNKMGLLTFLFLFCILFSWIEFSQKKENESLEYAWLEQCYQSNAFIFRYLSKRNLDKEFSKKERESEKESVDTER